MTTKVAHTTITHSALIKRINRKLAHDGERLVTPRSERDWQSCGYHVVNEHNLMTASRVEPEQLGRELGVLGDDEAVAS